MNEQAPSNVDPTLSYTPLFSINGEMEDALTALRGVSGTLSMLSMGANDCLSHKNAGAALEMLSGVTDAAIQTINRETAQA